MTTPVGAQRLAATVALCLGAAVACGDSPGRFGSCCDSDDDCSTGICDVSTRTCSQTCQVDTDCPAAPRVDGQPTCQQPIPKAEELGLSTRPVCDAVTDSNLCRRQRPGAPAPPEAPTGLGRLPTVVAFALFVLPSVAFGEAPPEPKPEEGVEAPEDGRDTAILFELGSLLTAEPGPFDQVGVGLRRALTASDSLAIRGAVGVRSVRTGVTSTTEGEANSADDEAVDSDRLLAASLAVELAVARSRTGLLTVYAGAGLQGAMGEAEDTDGDTADTRQLAAYGLLGVRLRPLAELSISAEHRMGVSLTETTEVSDQTVRREGADSLVEVETTTSETVVGTGVTGFFVAFHF